MKSQSTLFQALSIVLFDEAAKYTKGQILKISPEQGMGRDFIFKIVEPK